MLESKNEALEQEFSKKGVDKKAILGLLTQKIKEQEAKTKDIEKQF